MAKDYQNALRRMDSAQKAATAEVDAARHDGNLVTNGMPCICSLCVRARASRQSPILALQRIEAYCQSQIDRNSDEALLWAQCRKIALDALDRGSTNVSYSRADIYFDHD